MTATTEPGTTGPGTVTLDLTDATTTVAAVATLNGQQRALLLRALRDADSAEHDAAVLDIIHEKLSEVRHPADAEAVGVVFYAEAFDNGCFLSGDGTVVFADGGTRDIEFDVDDLFTDEYGPRGADFTLYVHLRTGQMDPDDYPDDHPQTRFKVPVPASAKA